MNFYSRLAEIRKAAGISQVEIASRCGVSREMWGKYERGIAMPGGDVIAAIAEMGIDVLYILTGQRSASTAAGSNHSPANDLRPDQLALLDNYENCAPEDRDAARRLLAAAAQHRQTPPRQTPPRKTKAQGG